MTRRPLSLSWSVKFVEGVWMRRVARQEKEFEPGAGRSVWREQMSGTREVAAGDHAAVRATVGGFKDSTGSGSGERAGVPALGVQFSGLRKVPAGQPDTAAQSIKTH